MQIDSYFRRKSYMVLTYNHRTVAKTGGASL